MGTRSHKRLSTNEVGFTLIEVMIALVVLAVGVLGLLGFASTAIQGNASSEHIATATLLADDVLETARRAGYNGSLTANTTVTEPYQSISGYPFFQRVTLTQVNTPAIGMQTVTATVTWNATYFFGANSVAFSTIVAQ